MRDAIRSRHIYGENHCVRRHHAVAVRDGVWTPSECYNQLVCGPPPPPPPPPNGELRLSMRRLKNELVDLFCPKSISPKVKLTYFDSFDIIFASRHLICYAH